MGDLKLYPSSEILTTVFFFLSEMSESIEKSLVGALLIGDLKGFKIGSGTLVKSIVFRLGSCLFTL